MKKAVVVLVLALVATLAGAHTASADKTFTFYGAGWGHGLGMSQYGAYGLAQKGWTDTSILKHFYSGTSMGKLSGNPSTVRVGLLQNYGGTSVKAVNGGVEVRLGSVGGTLITTIPAGETWTLQMRGTHQIWLKKPNGTYHGGRGWGGPATNVYLRYQPLGSSVYMYATGHNYGRGSMEFDIYQACSGCAWVLRAINVVGAEGYLYGIAEVPNYWPTHAKQAQAIAARTYVFYKIRTTGQNREGCNCAVYASTFDQVYIGSDKENSPGGDQWVAAVKATAGKTVNQSGQAVGAFYHSSSGGLTENNENVWGGTPIGYLRGVCDPGDFTAANPNRLWTESRSGAAIGDALAAYTGTDIGNATSFSNISRGVSGRIISTKVNGTNGSVTVSGSTLRRALGLKESLAWINSNKHVTGAIRNSYDYRMCAPGLVQSPSISVTGGRYQRFAIGRIYANYSTGKAYWIHGPVLDKYLALGGHGGFLGLPTAGVHAIGTTGGVKAHFKGGRIYHKLATGAHEVHGLVLTEYLGQGHTGELGFPLTDVVATGPSTVQSTFEHGTISCNTSTGGCTTTKTP